MELRYYKTLEQRTAILRKFGYDSDCPDSAKSKRAWFILDLIMEEDKYLQKEFDMTHLIFGGKLHIRKYRKKHDWIMRKARARRDAAKHLLSFAGQHHSEPHEEVREGW